MRRETVAKKRSKIDVIKPKGPDRIKCTYYLEQSDVQLLEDARYRRRKAGEKVDFSELVREAIRSHFKR
jgi:hypothetical protein